MSILKSYSDYPKDHNVNNSHRVGDVIRVVYSDFGKYDEDGKVRQFIGLCISRVNRGGYLSYILRNVYNNIPVDFGFDTNSPLIVSISKEDTYKRSSTRRAKLFYLRKLGITASRIKK